MCGNKNHSHLIDYGDSPSWDDSPEWRVLLMFHSCFGKTLSHQWMQKDWFIVFSLLFIFGWFNKMCIIITKSP